MRLRAGAVLLIVGVTGAWGAMTPAAATFPNDEKTIAHVLNRIGFGPRPGDIQRVQAMGLERYIDDQLHPERVPDPNLATRLSGFETTALSTNQISDRFERPQLEMRRKLQQQGIDPADPNAQRPPEAMAIQQKANSVLVELGEQKMLRAVYSERQLSEVLADFWFNHFNVDSRKGRDRFMVTEYERDTIRPRVLGKFRDLLGATAKSPAMLFYLDNWQSVDPNGPHPDPAAIRRAGRGPFRPFLVAPPAQAKNQKRGLNENYGRELMELHTLGVDGGYTQHDVAEVARCFTGWTMKNPHDGTGFFFDMKKHDRGVKHVLGHTIAAGRGIEDGEEVLDILARHPATAHFIATKLVRHFVADDPPPALVERAAKSFRKTDGDLREVVRVIVASREFAGAAAYRAKVKSPFEYVASALRATGASITNPRGFSGTIANIGEPLYQCQPPTGYGDRASVWINTGTLVSRLNFVQALVTNGANAARVNVPRSEEALGRFAVAVLAGDLSARTQAAMAAATMPLATRTAIVLGSPEFQHR